MTTKELPRVHSACESIPDQDRIRLIEDRSYVVIDENGKEYVQRVEEFQEENRQYFEEDLVRTRSQMEFAHAFNIQKKSQFLFFALPTRVIWDEFQTPIRNQDGRNTCSVFGAVAAIEARYKRDFGLDLNLSEQFYWHCYKSTSLSVPKRYQYENQSSFWGGGNAQGIQNAVNFAIPLEEDCPYLSRGEMNALRDEIPGTGQLEWKNDPGENRVTQAEVDAFEFSPLYIPDSARQNARYGVKHYVLFDQSAMRNTRTLEWLLAWGIDVIVNVDLKWRVDPETGVREYDPSSDGGWHVFLVVGFDQSEKTFYVKNSWGESGLIRVSYDFAKNCFGSGSAITAVRDPNRPSLKHRAMGHWNINHDGWQGELVIRRYTNASNDVTRLGHYHAADGTRKAVNGRAIHDGRGIEIFLTNGDDTDITSVEGQRFEIDVYSWDIKQAAGTTDWSNVPFGVYMHRGPIHSSSDSNFHLRKWLGTWSMNHDGWPGTLTLQNVVPVPSLGGIIIGEYTAAQGTPKAIVATVDPQHNHVLRFGVPISPSYAQPFVLHFHTWSADLASGYTVHNGQRYGAVAFKQST